MNLLFYHTENVSLKVNQVKYAVGLGGVVELGFAGVFLVEGMALGW